MVREVRKRVNEELISRIAENVKENMKTFWKGVNGVRKGESEVVGCEKLNGCGVNSGE